MKYVLVATTRDYVDITVPAIREKFLQSAQLLQDWQRQGIVEVVCLTGPFTPMKTLVILNAEDHNQVFSYLSQLQALPYMNVSVSPYIDWPQVIAYLQSL